MHISQIDKTLMLVLMIWRHMISILMIQVLPQQAESPIQYYIHVVWYSAGQILTWLLVYVYVYEDDLRYYWYQTTEYTLNILDYLRANVSVSIIGYQYYRFLLVIYAWIAFIWIILWILSVFISHYWSVIYTNFGIGKNR